MMSNLTTNNVQHPETFQEFHAIPQFAIGESEPSFPVWTVEKGQVAENTM